MVQGMGDLCGRLDKLSSKVVSAETRAYCGCPGGGLPATSSAVICNARVYNETNAYLTSGRTFQAFNQPSVPLGDSTSQAPSGSPVSATTLGNSSSGNSSSAGRQARVASCACGMFGNSSEGCKGFQVS